MGVYNIVQVESKEGDKESKEKLANKDQIEAAGSEHIMIVKIAEIRWWRLTRQNFVTKSSNLFKSLIRGI